MNETEKNMNITNETVDRTVFPQYTQPYKEPESEQDSGSVRHRKCGMCRRHMKRWTWIGM